MKLYHFAGGQFDGRYMDDETAMQMHYLYGNGLSRDWSEERENGGCVPKEELDSELKFKGYFGPMWEGEAYIVNGEVKYDFECTKEEKETFPECYILHYETPEVYERMSI